MPCYISYFLAYAKLCHPLFVPSSDTAGLILVLHFNMFAVTCLAGIDCRATQWALLNHKHAAIAKPAVPAAARAEKHQRQSRQSSPSKDSVVGGSCVLACRGIPRPQCCIGLPLKADTALPQGLPVLCKTSMSLSMNRCSSLHALDGGPNLPLCTPSIEPASALGERHVRRNRGTITLSAAVNWPWSLKTLYPSGGPP
jgi:hypothetical protein